MDNVELTSGILPYRVHCPTFWTAYFAKDFQDTVLTGRFKHGLHDAYIC